MAACDLAIPKILYRSTLEYDADHHGEDPTNCENDKAVHRESYLFVGKNANVKEENGHNDKAHGRAPRKLLDKDTPILGEQ